MNRNQSIQAIQDSSKIWDVVIIGGGASGLGAAVDASSRGYDTLLVEKNDFSQGTSSRSTKLVHGGVRYLQNGDVSLVIEALKERGIMKKNAPHLVKNQSFVIPSYDWWDSPFYGIGLKIYDMMAGKLGLGPSTILSKEETINYIPNINQKGLRGGVIYQDGQFDDARMAISLALTASKQGAIVINYMELTGFLKNNELVSGVQIRDTIDGDQYEIRSKVVINATGVFSDDIMQLDDPSAKNKIMPSQGVHIVLDKKFLDTSYSIMVPHTTDGRVLFAVPWKDHVIVGTTDTPQKEHSFEPKPTEKEIEFILENAGAYMSIKPTKSDIKSTFAGLRPLAATDENKPTKEVSRHHKVIVSQSGLVSILGGKWTTYRKMAEDTINTAMSVGGLPERKCLTADLPIYGFDYDVNPEDPLAVYGTEAEKIRNLDANQESLSESFFISEATILWGVQKEMAMKVEDVLARRSRGLFLETLESKKIAPQVAKIMAQLLNKDSSWIEEELKSFESLATNYVA